MDGSVRMMFPISHWWIPILYLCFHLGKFQLGENRSYAEKTSHKTNISPPVVQGIRSCLGGVHVSSSFSAPPTAKKEEMILWQEKSKDSVVAVIVVAVVAPVIVVAVVAVVAVVFVVVVVVVVIVVGPRPGSKDLAKVPSMVVSTSVTGVAAQKRKWRRSIPF